MMECQFWIRVQESFEGWLGWRSRLDKSNKQSIQCQKNGGNHYVFVCVSMNMRIFRKTWKNSVINFNDIMLCKIANETKMM